jgi:hypothetical protein
VILTRGSAAAVSDTTRNNSRARHDHLDRRAFVERMKHALRFRFARRARAVDRHDLIVRQLLGRVVVGRECRGKKPRTGIVVKPVAALSLYASYSIS